MRINFPGGGRPARGTGNCRDCEQPIRFVELNNGRRTAVELDQVDATKLPEGCDRLVTSEGEIIQHPRTERQGWVPHYDVCPNGRRAKRA